MARTKEVLATEPPSTAIQPSVTAAEQHIMWLDRQETYLTWAGLTAAFTLALSFLGVSAWLIYYGHEVGGTILGTVDLVALVTVFITGRAIGRAEERTSPTSKPEAGPTIHLLIKASVGDGTSRLSPPKPWRPREYFILLGRCAAATMND